MGRLFPPLFGKSAGALERDANEAIFFLSVAPKEWAAGRKEWQPVGSFIEKATSAERL